MAVLPLDQVDCIRALVRDGQSATTARVRSDLEGEVIEGPATRPPRKR